ncbi:MAG: undecaprenyl-phosphate glucose phosphotransferase [Acidobacteria bacterium]|nr:MAG: undecaprenyl-phosphate glucose phosphotransferase [Acidobacteriota bacterium]REK08692.1 MAG: undecaprenyl-phosphate glucose phosphotransferase [Acidobacteriota bacterium]
MIRQRHFETRALFVLADLSAITLAFFAAWFLRFELELVPLRQAPPPFSWYLPLLPGLLLLWPVVFYFHGLYQNRRGNSRIEEFFTLAIANGLATLILAGVATFYRPVLDPGSGSYAFFSFSRVFLTLLLACSIVFTTASRLSIRAVLRELRRRGHNIRRVLVIGAGTLGREVANRILSHRELGFDVVGFLDDDQELEHPLFSEVPILGPLGDLNAVLEEKSVDQLMVALPVEAHKRVLEILEAVETECVEVRLVPDLLQYASLRAGLEDIDGLPVINLSHVPLEGWQSLAKRSLDLVVSGLLMLAMLPFLPLVAALIWLEDRGPIFYSQERMGLDGRAFMIHKFRSMRVDAESSTGPIWAVEEDPRRTRIGSLLRRTSIDELPQLWNVFRGEMSLVGPRPERPAFVHEFKHKIPRYMLRHRVKAGITGWAQVHGWRGNTSIKKRLQYDLYYIENWSLKLDFKILWMTLRHGWLDNAY